MKIAVTATGPNLEANIDPRFGRCGYFLFVETDDLTFEAVENPNISIGGGAGIQSAQLIAEKGAKAVLTGNCGPNAYRTLEAAGVQVIIGTSGTVKDAVEQFKAGGFSAAGQPNVQSHFGMPGGPAAFGPMGGPFGAGMGRGGGRGRGMGPMVGPFEAGQEITKDQELEILKQQAQGLEQQMQQIMKRIKELESEE